MKTSNFLSCLAEQMESFIALRRLSGTDYQSQTRLLKYFDDFLVKEYFNGQCLTRNIVQRYFVSISHLNPRTQYNRFSVIRQFCRYLSGFDPFCYVPESMRPVNSMASRIPYIFTEDQIQALLAEATKLLPRHSLRPYTCRTLFGLLYTTGIRIGEAMALNIEDAYLNSERLHIRKGKFHKARLIPLSSSTCSVLEQYIDLRQHTAPLTSDAPLFVNLRHNRLHHSTVHKTFRTLLKPCNIHTSKSSGPRIHDFRHTFAVHRLLQWYRDGQDVNARLPALATYMGHVDINSSQVYLQATSELLEQGNQRFLRYFRQNIKNNGGLL